MKHRIQTMALGALVSIAMPLAAQVSAQTATKAVRIDAGRIEGTVSGDVLSFKGIPYASAPVGRLRWRAPQPVKSWKGVRKATRYGHDCIQEAMSGDAAARGTVLGEDCLMVNVWRPAASRSGEKLPVMVWIHGGGFVNGGSSEAMLDGSEFARQGLIFVSLNYRLGRLGFFAHPALTAAKEGPLANYGLLDQLAALRWVRRNIAAFGGDPHQVTIVGESAGGLSVIHLLTWPEAKGLFHRAVVMSGGGRIYLKRLRKLSEGAPELPSAEESGLEFAKSMGITGTGTAALKALRALPANKVNGDLNMRDLLNPTPTYAGGPVIDGEIITSMPEEVLRRGEAAKVPLIIGTTSQDLPVTFPPSRENPLSFFGRDSEKARALYDPGRNLPPLGLLMSVAVDMTMHEPARFAARQMTAAGNPAWLYRFSYVAQSLRPKSIGAEHATEVAYLFNTLEAHYGKDATEKDRAMARAFHTYMANFAKYGDPNGAGLPTWHNYDPAQSELMNFTLDRGPVIEADPWKARLDLVERAVEGQASSPTASPNAGDLGSTSWRLVKFQSGDDRMLVPDDRAKYTISFGSDGRLSARIDCNRGVGTWKSAGPNQIEFGPLALTRAMCPPGSLHDRIAKDWQFVRSFTLKAGHLFLSLMADGGIYEFEPLAR